MCRAFFPVAAGLVYAAAVLAAQATSTAVENGDGNAPPTQSSQIFFGGQGR
jgi:hypothetical protein